MFHTLTNIQRGVPVSLWRPLDNREGRASVALRSLTYNVGWHNVHKAETFHWQNSDTGKSGTVEIPAGLYSFEALKDLLLQAGSGFGLSLDVNQENGFVSLVVPLSIAIKLSSQILELLGLDVQTETETWIGPGTYVGSRPINFALTSALFIHLDELSTIHNMFDGTPSTLLGVVSLGCESFGENATIYIPAPEFKRLSQEYITELTVSVRDVQARKIDNHTLPLSLTIEVIVGSAP